VIGACLVFQLIEAGHLVIATLNSPEAQLL